MPRALDELREGALILLYRLLFVLYAEDRNLLPDQNGALCGLLADALRLEVAEKKAQGDVPFSDRIKAYWSRLDGVFQAIAQGDDSLGIPPIMVACSIQPPRRSSPACNFPIPLWPKSYSRLSHARLGDGRPPKYINYRDLSVQQLGSVYERILEHGLKLRTASRRPRITLRRGGLRQYYTPEELVALIIERAVGPMVSEHVVRSPRRPPRSLPTRARRIPTRRPAAADPAAASSI